MSVFWQSIPMDERAADVRMPELGSSLSPKQARDLAMALAWRGLGHVAPNPMVGAVILDREGRLIGAGAHEYFGGPHAEVNALAHAQANGLGAALRGASLHVTLEPCAHVGKTGSCATRLVGTGIQRVYFGAIDPNPQVAGRGAAILRAAGIEAEAVPAWEEACVRLAEVFFHHMRHKLPFVGLKVAASLDGVMARRGDQRQWITGHRARAYGHFLRQYYDAILIGRGTLVADDPSLDVRDVPEALKPRRRHPRCVVLDPQGKALTMAKPWRLLEHDPARVLWLVGAGNVSAMDLQRLRDSGVAVVALLPDADGSFSPQDILTALAQAQISSVLVEGGAGTYGRFLHAGAVNRLHLFQAPMIFGGASTTAAPVLNFAAACPEMRLPAGASVEISPLGDDWLIDLPLEWRLH